MIDRIAIAYGDTRNGRSCASCNYVKKKIMGAVCGLHNLDTKLGKVCGAWCDTKKKDKKSLEQPELY